MERKEILTVVLVGVLLLTVAVQTVQLIGLSNAQVITPSTASAKTSVYSGGAQGSANGGGSLANLPSMVGGC